MILVEKSRVLFLLISLSIKIRAINKAVNKEVKIPTNKVVAKPLIGPVPKINKITPVMICVTLASIIGLNAEPFHP